MNRAVSPFDTALIHHMYAVQPLLDVILFTRSLSRVMGYKGQLGLYVYYIFSALLLRALTPPLALMTAQESGLSASFRTAHQVCLSDFTFPLQITVEMPLQQHR